MKGIPKDAPEKLVDKIKGMMQFGNEPSLGQRLKQISNEIKLSFEKSPPFLSKENIRRLVATRNYYTHFNEGLRAECLSNDAMHHDSERIIFLLTVLFFERIGINAKENRGFFEQNHRFAEYWETTGNPFM